MPKVQATRNATLRSRYGYTFEFEAGKQYDIPQICMPEAGAIGAFPADDEATKALDEALAPPKNPNDAPIDPDERKALIRETILQMVAENKQSDFGASGRPHVKKISKRLGFDISPRERDAVWEALLDAGEVQP